MQEQAGGFLAGLERFKELDTRHRFEPLERWA